MKIIKAHINDAECISDLTFRSKNYWGYGKDQIEAWKEDLTITPEYITKNHVYTLGDNNKIIGFYAFQSKNAKEVYLDFLFIDPNYIGKGYGKIALLDFIQRIQGLKYEKITLDADPHAEKFYKKNGFRRIGSLKSSIKDRFLPIMELNIHPKL